MKKALYFLSLGLLILMAITSCEDDSTAMGVNMQDPSTLFNGEWDSITSSNIIAYTSYDSNLRTSGYTTAMIGHYSDATFGDVEATLYTQLGLTGSSGIRFGEIGATIDSVVLTMSIDKVYPPKSTAHLHLKVSQLSERLYADTNYSANRSISTGTVFYSGDYNYVDTNTNIRIKLGGGIESLFSNTYESLDDFQNQFKGLCIQADRSQSDAVLLSFNFTSSSNKVRVYYTYQGDTNHYDLTLGHNSTASTLTHFCKFSHNYAGTIFSSLINGSADSLDGAQTLYLEPLGGMEFTINIDQFVQRFHAAHPYATIHYAEMLLPVSSNADTNHPELINAYKRYANGASMMITDGNSLVNNYTYNGYDGTYNKSKGYYRIRCTQHLQELLRVGHDNGTLFLLNERRSKAARTILNGPSNSTAPLKIRFVYTEGR